jgi:glycosyltransferase involved in cell wall biosynthesis
MPICPRHARCGDGRAGPVRASGGVTGLRIGIDGGCWLNRRGYGRYTRSLLSALAQCKEDDQYFIFVDRETAGAPDLPARFHKVVVPTRETQAEAASASGHRSVSDLCRMGWAVARCPLDVFFFPSVYTFFPILRPRGVVVAIHDVIAEHHPDQVFAHRRLALFWRLKLALAIRQARLIVTVSDHARRGIIDHFGLQPERVRTILEAPDAVFRPVTAARDPADLLPAWRLPRGKGRYLLYVGGFSPHKNLHVLIQAFRRVFTEDGLDDLRLLLVGDYERDVFYSAYESLRAEVQRHGLEDRVCFTGYVSDDVLVELYNRAELLILPSLEEGFGLPAFEAAACGTPIVTTDAGPAAGLLGPGAWVFSPRDVGALTRGLCELLNDPTRRRAMGEAARTRVQAFSWDRAAIQARDVFLEVSRT